MIRPAVPADARAIAEVQVASWHAAYRGLMPDAVLDAQTVPTRTDRWRDILTDARSDRRTTVYERGGDVVGFASVGPSRDEGADVGELWALYAAPKAWRSGVGRVLLEDALRWLVPKGYREVTLWVLRGNARGIAFYEAMGFRFDGATKQEREMDELRMRRALP